MAPIRDRRSSAGCSLTGGGLAACDVELTFRNVPATVLSMSNTTARTAETKMTAYERYPSTGKETTRYETDYRFAKRDFGGWTIHLTDPSALRTIEQSWGDSDITTGSIGWVTKNHNGGWDLWHAVAGEIKAQQYGIGWSTRDEAAQELIRNLIQRHIVSPAATSVLIARDSIDHNELVLTASRVVEQFGWEADYEAYLARRQEAN